MYKILFSSKKLLIENFFLSSIGAVYVIVTVFAQFISIFNHSRFLKLNLSFLSLYFLCIFLTGCFKVRKKKHKGHFLQSQYAFSNRGRSLAAFGFFLSPIFLIYPGFVAKDFLDILKIKDHDCAISQKKIGVLIANFSVFQDGDDGFSSNLFGKLNSKLQNVDTINLRQIKKYIAESSESYLDTIKTAIRENCSNSGLVVFGNRKDEKQFNCRIYSVNFLKFSPHALATSDKTIIYIENPDVVNFSIENESAAVAKFILGLLSYHKGDFTQCHKFINEALFLNTNKHNSQFIALCHLFVGNTYSFKKEYSKAIKEYKKGILVDETNGFLHFNIASVYKAIGKSDSAKSSFKLAKIYESNLDFHSIELIERERPIVHLALKKESKRDTSLNTPIKKAAIESDWLEQCLVVEKEKKFGVINNKGDTIVYCKYDAIRGYVYKDADVFLVRSGKKYGAVIHVHTFDGYKIHKIPVEFSFYTIDKALDHCLDNAKYE